jgi:hypothetical protein
MITADIISTITDEKRQRATELAYSTGMERIWRPWPFERNEAATEAIASALKRQLPAALRHVITAPQRTKRRSPSARENR